MTTATEPTTPKPNPDPGAQPGHQADGGGPAGETEREKGLRLELEKQRQKNRDLQAENQGFKTAQQTAETKRLQEQGEYKELAERHGKERDEYKSKFETTLKRQQQIYVDAEVRARRSELIDPDDAKLFDAQGLEVGEDGEVKDFDKRWGEFKAKKAHLFKAAGSEPAARLPSPDRLTPGTGGSAAPKQTDPMKMTKAEFLEWTNSEAQKIQR